MRGSFFDSLAQTNLLYDSKYNYDLNDEFNHLNEDKSTEKEYKYKLLQGKTTDYKAELEIKQNSKYKNHDATTTTKQKQSYHDGSKKTEFQKADKTNLNIERTKQTSLTAPTTQGIPKHQNKQKEKVDKEKLLKSTKYTKITPPILHETVKTKTPINFKITTVGQAYDIKTTSPNILKLKPLTITKEDRSTTVLTSQRTRQPQHTYTKDEFRNNDFIVEQLNRYPPIKLESSTTEPLFIGKGAFIGMCVGICVLALLLVIVLLVIFRKQRNISTISPISQEMYSDYKLSSKNNTRPPLPGPRDQITSVSSGNEIVHTEHVTCYPEASMMDTCIYDSIDEMNIKSHDDDTSLTSKGDYLELNRAESYDYVIPDEAKPADTNDK